MAGENPTWGEERIDDELLLKLGIRASARTVIHQMPDDTRARRCSSSQRWLAFVRNHVQGILACDSSVAATASFRVLQVFENTEVGTRGFAYFYITPHTTSDWTLQQVCEVITGEKLPGSSSTTTTAFARPISIRC